MSIIIVGAGPNLGAAIAQRAHLAQRAEADGLAESPDVENVAYRPADVRDAEALSDAINAVRAARVFEPV